jgi:hypothetical protein
MEVDYIGVHANRVTVPVLSFFNYQRKTQIAIQSVFKPRSFSDYRFSVADK